ncbi:DUF4865 domain-containing protein [Bacilli bacterium]|nr:DUF4865 domain-containing protein [Bacilli bacterium]
MQAMRYDIILPTDYDMTIIRERVKKTGHLMDGFPDLLFKLFLISEKKNGEYSNSYSPLYVWKNSDGMSHFIFDGFFDNILTSFGWQQIEIGVTSTIALGDDFLQSQFVTEEVEEIPPTESLKTFEIHEKSTENETGKLVIYNPDKWRKVIFTFYLTKPQTKHRCFEILHLSRG